jgi:hypothetical protein
VLLVRQEVGRGRIVITDADRIAQLQQRAAHERTKAKLVQMEVLIPFVKQFIITTARDDQAEAARLAIDAIDKLNEKQGK